MGGLARRGHGEPQQTGGDGDHGQRCRRRAGLGHDRGVGLVAALDGRRHAALVIHHLLAHDGLEDQVALQPDAAFAERAGRERLRQDARLHVGRAAPPDAVVVDAAGERITALPLGGVAGRHDVDVPVVDQGAPAARARDDADGVLAPGLDRPQVDLGSRVPR